MKLKVAIDARALTVTRTGGGYYTQGLLDNFDDPDIEFFACAHRALEFAPRSKNIHIREGHFPLGMLWQQIGLPAVLAKEKIDILHSPLFTVPLHLRCPSLITVFDLTTMLFPQLHMPKIRFSLNSSIKISTKKARKIIAISENTRRDIIRRLGVREEKVVVIYPGVDDCFKPRRGEAVEEARNKYVRGSKFILHVGTLEPRKNIGFLIDVFRQVEEMSSEPLCLVVAGARGWGYADLFRKVSEFGIEDKVLFPGYIPRDQLPYLYNAAEMLVFPSLYEGFGLPLVEAMASGLPLVAGAASSIPEVAGEAGMVINDWNVEEWAENILSILSDNNMRRDMAGKGLEQAKKFSWTKCTRQIGALYREIA